MGVRISITVASEGAIEGDIFVDLIRRVEATSRRAAVSIARQIVTDVGAPEIVFDAAAWRLWTYPESFFWIEDIGNGSKWLKGVIYTAAITVILESTIGESLSEGWKKTKIHSQIVEGIPKVEDLFVEGFKTLFPIDGPEEPKKYEADRVAITRDDDDWIVELRARSLRTKKTDR
ncbi:MAG: hypothetical protein K8F62_16800 [Pseudorhodoplanes sp.]|nr:hypothetical protein [Pseudorhodoplanes sp.]